MLSKIDRCLFVCLLMIVSLTAFIEAAALVEYNLDEVTGNVAVDSSGNGNDGTIVNAPTDDSQWVSGIVDGGLYLDGTDYLLTDVSVTGDHTYTIACYVSAPSTLDVTNTIYGEFKVGVKSLLTVRCSNGKLNVWLQDDNGTNAVSLTTTRIVFDNSWHHVALTNDSGNITLYVDGQLDATASYDPAAFTWTASDEAMIGARGYWVNGAAVNYYTSGKIDKFTAHQDALNQSQILKLYSGLTGDLDDDADVDLNDLQLFALLWLDSGLDQIPPCSTDIVADLDEDCDVDFIDFTTLASQWLKATNVSKGYLFSDVLTNVEYIPAPQLSPVSNSGWSYTSMSPVDCYQTNVPGSKIEFQAAGEAIAILFYRNENYGKARIRLDAGDWETLDGYYPKPGNIIDTRILSFDLSPTIHTIEFELLDETSAPSGGKDFKIFAIGRGGPSVVPPSVPPVVAGSVTWSPSDAGVPNPVSVLDQNSLFARSLTDIGDTSRLKEVMAKAERGEPITIATIGGSITQGAAASEWKYRYANQLAGWWHDKFPNTTIRFVNAGIGGTGSLYGVFRSQYDLHPYDPDFVIVEFAVNDGDALVCYYSYEGLVRQILSKPNQPAVMQVFMMRNDGDNEQPWQAQIGAQYGLPSISFRDAFWPELEAGNILWEDIYGDLIHPNDLGHEYVAKFVTNLLEMVYQDLP